MKKLILPMLLVLALFLRTYRISDLLGFWYDQGRDALVVADLIQRGNFFLIGPTTGIEGIFLGPFYYYLITPFYWLAGGDPAVPAIGLAIINVAAIWITYRLGSLQSRSAGLLAVLISSLSLELIFAQRWLSNPTPLPFFALIVVWCLHKLTSGSTAGRWWLGLGLCLGLGLQLEAASAVFFLPAVAIILGFYRRRIVSNRAGLVLGCLLFLFTLVPQLWFNFRNQNLLFNSFTRFLVAERSFQAEVTDFYAKRLDFYATAFSNLFFPDLSGKYVSIFVLAALALLGAFVWRPARLYLIWVLTPVVFLLFYHGNNGFVWGYYFTGIYGVWVLLVVAGLVVLSRFLPGQVFVLLFLGVFLYQNLPRIYLRLIAPQTGYISLSQIKSAVDWVYTDSAGRPFNIDVYVPPMISYSYDYVFAWKGETQYGRLPEKAQVKLLYTIMEPDPDQQTLYNDWFIRQSTFSSIDKTHQIGPLLLHRRSRHTIN